jgi:hypothetical protein
MPGQATWMLEATVRTRPSGRDLRTALKGGAASVALLLGLAMPATAKGPPTGQAPGQVKQLADASAAPAHGRQAAPGQVKKAGSVAAAPRAGARAVAGTPRAAPVATVPTTANAVPTAQPTATSAQPTRRRTTRPQRARRVSRPQTRAASATRQPPSRLAAAAPVAAAVAATSAPAEAAKARPPRHRHAAPHRAQQQAPPVQRITHTITRTVGELVQVYPTWAKALIGGLSVLLLGALALIGGTALRNRRLRRQRAALLDQVGVLQGALLPIVPERIGSVSVSVAYRPAEGIAAGGDFYDVFPLEDGSVAMILGDVSGHGKEALGPATFIRHMVRSYVEAGLTPRAALQLTGNVLDDQDREDFATIAVAVYDSVAGTLSFATAGHPPPIITGATGYEPVTIACSPPAGIGYTTGLRQTTLALPPDSTVCFYTDGVTEARTHEGLFGRERLEEIVNDLDSDASAEDLVDRVTQAADGFRDDVAVCLLRTGSAAAAGTVRVEEIEVTLSDLHSPRLRRFFEGCGVRGVDAAAAIRTAAPHVAGLGSVLLRVRMAFNRSGVDVVPVATSTRAAEVIPASPVSRVH